MMQRIDGLWTVEGISLDTATSAGVLVLCCGQVVGGGERYYCVGSYKAKRAIVEIDVKFYHYHGAVHSPVAGARPDFQIRFRGRVLTELIEGNARCADGAVSVPFRLVWRAPLEAYQSQVLG